MKLYFKQKSVFAWIVYNVLRFIPIILFSWIFYIVYYFKYLNKKKTGEYSVLLNRWLDACKDKESLISYFTRQYDYKYDLIGGFMDHDSGLHEWVIGNGDCDDMALYSKKVLKSLGYESYRIGIMWFPKYKLPILHFDCLTINRDDNGNVIEARLFNYGNEIVSSSIEEVLYTLTGRYTNDRNTSTKICVCLY